MAINKKLIHFNKKTTFNSQKLSANVSNTQYQVGGTGTVQTGAPDINYQSIVYIKDSKEIWTHGQFYGSAASVAWSAITGKPSFATVATSGSYNDLSNKPTIPTSLPTPNSLTFTGATTGTWNGSAAKTVNIPTYSNASTSSAGLMSASDKSKLDGIASGANNYSLPTASSTTLGGIKVGSGLSISNGVLSTTGSSVSWRDVTNKPTMVTLVEPGSPSVDWQSAYVPLDITYSNATTAHKNISLPMARPASDSSQGSAGLITGADKKKLDDLSTGVFNMIKSREAYVRCDTSTNDISLYSPEVITLDTTMTTITSTNTIFNGGEDVTFNNSGTLNVNCDAILTEHLTIGGVDGPERRTLYLHGDLAQDGGDASFTGTVSADGGFFDTSDARVKTNVKELNAINADAIKLVEFDRTDIEHHGYGVIAQELEKVYPEMVNTDDEGFKSVNYNELAMVKIKYLEDKVARLEALVGRLLAE